MKASSYAGVAGATAAWMVMLLAVAALRSAPSAYASVSGCNATELAIAISKDCIDGDEPMSDACCSAILHTVDIVGCLCSVVDQPMIADSGTTSRALFR
uniref:Bifunctional inhibitor/plant lipid transfer protein/seed storage helical domain-containing protein n=1 Tax=Triticum urartu TaxID=4572 RepID=A0A8R7P3G5_TRIUA